jgi:hypothetical protein
VARQVRNSIYFHEESHSNLGVQAMIRLSEVPGQYQGLKLERCGLLFLSTPHSGSLVANWNDLIVELAKIGGVSRGHDFKDLLSAFNQQSAAAKERFGLLEPVPPIKCLYETQYTSIKGVNRMVRRG